MDSILTLTLEKEFDPKYCITCQKKNTKNLTSSENGRHKIIEAAAIRKDKVQERLTSHKLNRDFCYHMDNHCYKNYTLKKTLDNIEVSSLNFISYLIMR